MVKLCAVAEIGQRSQLVPVQAMPCSYFLFFRCAVWHVEQRGFGLPPQGLGGEGVIHREGK